MEAHLIGEAARELGRLKSLAERALDQVSDDAFFTTLDADSNSLALLVKHLDGNMRSRWTRFLTEDGEKPDRHRDREFEIEDGDTRSRLEERWCQSWNILFQTLSELQPRDLEATVHIRGEPHSVPQAIYRQMTHYAYHVGQIVQLAKHLAGDSWQTLSVPKGGSEAFNAAPSAYVSTDPEAHR